MVKKERRHLPEGHPLKEDEDSLWDEEYWALEKLFPMAKDGARKVTIKGFAKILMRLRSLEYRVFGEYRD
jgi:hypothetical protein